MATVDELLAAFRLALLADPTLVGLVPGGWLMDRQTSAQTAPYGLLRLDFVTQKQSSASIYRTYTLVAAVYSVVTATGQKDIPARLAFVLDYKPTNVTMPAGAGLIMISPRSLDQRLAREMKSGTDVTPLVSQWTILTCESRA